MNENLNNLTALLFCWIILLQKQCIIYSGGIINSHFIKTYMV